MDKIPAKEVIKELMGYTEQRAVKCKNCSWSESRENPHLDRDWLRICSFARVCEIEVSDDGRCRFYAEKTVANQEN